MMPCTAAHSLISPHRFTSETRNAPFQLSSKEHLHELCMRSQLCSCLTSYQVCMQPSTHQSLTRLTHMLLETETDRCLRLEASPKILALTNPLEEMKRNRYHWNIAFKCRLAFKEKRTTFPVP